MQYNLTNRLGKALSLGHALLLGRFWRRLLGITFDVIAEIKTQRKKPETDSNSSSSETHLPMGMASPSAIALARRSLARQSWHTSTSTLESGDQDLLSSGAAGVDKGSVPVGGGSQLIGSLQKQTMELRIILTH